MSSSRSFHDDLRGVIDAARPKPVKKAAPKKAAPKKATTPTPKQPAPRPDLS